MPRAQHVELTTPGELLEPELAGGLEHPDANLAWSGGD
jgi:hypothetical protein